jgi:ABC-2 type transport system ATP-binding protein
MAVLTMNQKSPSAIEVNQISKSFGRIQALRSVSFTVPQESVFCILGPNGAGKTTLLRILTTVTNPDSGQAKIEGFDIQTDVLQVRQRIGVVSQENRFDRYLSIWHNLTLHAQMHGMSPQVYEPRIKSFLEKIGLYERRFSLAEELSGGQQRRVALIRALIHSPKILFLDEPTTGLDPEARIEIWKTIEAFKQTATVILTTHYMDEADRLSDRILMLHHGSVVAEGSAQELKSRISPLDQFELLLKTPKAETYQTVLQAIPSHRGNATALQKVSVASSHRLAFETAEPEVLKEVISVIAPEDFLRIGQIEANLEEVFLSIAALPKQNSQYGAAHAPL